MAKADVNLLLSAIEGFIDANIDFALLELRSPTVDRKGALEVINEARTTLKTRLEEYYG